MQVESDGLIWLFIYSTVCLATPPLHLRLLSSLSFPFPLFPSPLARYSVQLGQDLVSVSLLFSGDLIGFSLSSSVSFFLSLYLSIILCLYANFFFCFFIKIFSVASFRSYVNLRELFSLLLKPIFLLKQRCFPKEEKICRFPAF